MQNSHRRYRFVERRQRYYHYIGVLCVSCIAWNKKKLHNIITSNVQLSFNNDIIIIMLDKIIFYNFFLSKNIIFIRKWNTWLDRPYIRRLQELLVSRLLLLNKSHPCLLCLYNKWHQLEFIITYNKKKPFKTIIVLKQQKKIMNIQ